jgi:hypothetical protein
MTDKQISDKLILERIRYEPLLFPLSRADEIRRLLKDDAAYYAPASDEQKRFVRKFYNYACPGYRGTAIVTCRFFNRWMNSHWPLWIKHVRAVQDGDLKRDKSEIRAEDGPDETD